MPITPKNWNSGDYANDVKTAIVTEPCVLASVVLSNTLTDDPISFMVCLIDAQDNLLAMLDIAEVGPGSTRVLPGRSLSVMSGQRLAFQANAQGGAVYATGVVSDSFNETDPRLQYATAAELSQAITTALADYTTATDVSTAIDTALQNYQPETDMAAVQEAIDDSVRALQSDLEAQSSAAISLIPNRQFDKIDENSVPLGWTIANAVAARDWHENHYDATLIPTGGGIPSLSTSIKNAKFLGGKPLRMSAEFSANAGSTETVFAMSALDRAAIYKTGADKRKARLDFTPVVSNPDAFTLKPSMAILPLTTATRRADMPSKRYGHQSAAAGNFIYVYGGRDDAFDWFNATSAKSDLLRLDTQSGSWEALPNTGNPGPVSGGVMVHHDGALYLFSGTPNRSNQSDDAILKNVWRYDLVDQTWSMLGATPFSLYWMAGAAGTLTATGDVIVACGGYNVTGNKSDVYLYDFATDAWVTIGTMPYAANNCGIVIVNDAVYLIGGFQSGSWFSSVYRGVISDTGSGPQIAWAQLDNMPIGRTSFGMDADHANGRIFVYGGNTANGIVSSIDVMNLNSPAGSMWSTVATPGAPAARFVGMSYVGGRLFTTGGYTGSTRLPDTWSMRTFRGLQDGQQITLPDATLLTGGVTDAELIVGAPCLIEKDQVVSEVRLTRAEYDALTSYDPNTHYIVEETAQ